MKRVVITGLGITSCIGNDKASVTESLKTGRSGITFQEDYASLGMRSQVAGVPKVDFKALIDRKALRFMGDAAAYAHIAMQHCIQDAGLTLEDLSNPKIGLVAGSGGASSAHQVDAADLLLSAASSSSSRPSSVAGVVVVASLFCSTNSFFFPSFSDGPKLVQSNFVTPLAHRFSLFLLLCC